MNLTLVDKFTKATEIALRLRQAGRVGLLGDQDYRQLLDFKSEGWNIYTNSSRVTKIISPAGDEIKIDHHAINVYGPTKEALL